MISDIDIRKKFDVNYFFDKIKEDLKEIEFNNFNLGVSYPYSLSEDEKQLLKKEFQYELVKKIESDLGKKKTDDLIEDIFILIDYNYNRIEYKIVPIYIYGIYNKYKRGISQTKDYCFKCKGRGCKFCNHKGVLKEVSVQETIANFLKKYIYFTENKFHGAGREDIDVLMLGNGREFIIELIDPKIRTIEIEKLKNIEEEFNKLHDEVKITSLIQTEKNKVPEIKNKINKKLYKVEIDCFQEINEKTLEKIKTNEKININQFTPKRISKRRAQITRKRSAEILKVEFLDSKRFIIELKAEAGLYIKEFISGDEGKTTPSISEIIDNNCNCKQLDVVWIYR